jgi:medium-chain acyl-[acyl-carrier-protein] hydrolase
MEPQPVWLEETCIKTYETDFKGHWKPSCLVQNLTEAASKHAAHLGYDYSSLWGRGMVWVLARIKIHFIEPLRMGESVFIKTWPKGFQQKLFFMRDFDLRAPDGKLRAAASSAWLLIDPLVRRILPPQALGGVIPDNKGVAALAEPLEKIILPEGLNAKMTVDASYSATDLLGHVNSARYVDWVCDCFSHSDHLARRLEWLQINYNNETKPGERLSIAAAPNPTSSSRWFIQGTNLDSGLKSFDATLDWEM